MPNRKIYLGNLNQTTTDIQIKEYFSEYGEITEISLPLDRKTQQPKGYAFISFADQNSAERALEKDGELLLGQEITVQLATEKRKKKLSPL
jgi:RNA recognition motif-containing protein